MKKQFITLIACATIAGSVMTVFAEDVYKPYPYNSGVKIAATAKTIVDVLSYPLVAYPVYTFVFDQIKTIRLLGTGGITWGTSVALGLLAAMSARELYLSMHNAFGCSDEFISELCKESKKQEAEIVGWAVLGAIFGGLGVFSRNCTTLTTTTIVE